MRLFSLGSCRTTLFSRRCHMSSTSVPSSLANSSPTLRRSQTLLNHIASNGILTSRCFSSASALLSANHAAADSVASSDQIERFDLIIVGSGGAAKLFRPCSHDGLKVAICEHGPFGGTCLNRGCIPSKMLIHPAEVVHTIVHEAKKFGITASTSNIDFRSIVDHVTSTIDAEAASIPPNIARNPNLTHFPDTARFIAPKVLQCGDRIISADKIIVAAGCRPYIPPNLRSLPVITSTEALRLNTKPKSMIVYGGGFIACELAFYFSMMGVDVHVVSRSSLIRAADTETANHFRKEFSQYVHLHDGCVLDNVSYQDGQFTATVRGSATSSTSSSSSSLTCDQLLVATGVQPNTDQLDMAAGQIELDSRGYVKVDEFLQTNQPGVYAMGDVTGQHMFRHSANLQAEYLYENVLAPDRVAPVPISFEGMPWAMFTTPQVASVGETEEQLQARGASYVVGVNPYSSSAMGMALRSTSGFCKALVEKDTRRILGVHIVGEQAACMLHEVTPLMRKQGTLDDVLNSIHIHPALNEILRNSFRKCRDALVKDGYKLSPGLRLK